MAKATTTQIKYLKERLENMLYEKMREWRKKNPEPSLIQTSEILKMLKKGELKLRKTPLKKDEPFYGYSSDIETYFEMPDNGRKSWVNSKERVEEAYRASIITIMDSFVLSGSDFTMALQAFEDLNIE